MVEEGEREMRVVRGNILSFCRHYHGEKFHALLCDPPYSLGFMGKEWDHDIAFDPETWAALAEHLYPGGFGMAFASSRGWHRLAVAIEDAGLRIHPSIFGWVFGSGFPKATRIDTQIDKNGGRARYEKDRQSLAAHIREKRTAASVSVKEMASWFPYKEVTKNWERQDAGGRWPNSNDYGVLIDRLGCSSTYRDVVREEEKRQVIDRSNNGIAGGTKQHAGEDESWGFNGEFDITAPATDLAKSWEDHRYGLQALKPALEPIIVFQKPYEGKPVESIVETGAGALNIDGGRIPLNGDYKCGANGRPSQTGLGDNYDSDKANLHSEIGRWPANFYVDEEAAARLGEQSGERPSGSLDFSRHTDRGKQVSCYGKYRGGDSREGKFGGDTGTAARFFFNVNRQIDESDPVLYCAKASRKERDVGLEEFALSEKWDRKCVTKALEGMGSLTKPVRNAHPTVKPIDLTRWLATLLLPPDVYAPRRILVPFAGSGSEMIGAHLAGWEEIIGIESEREYVEIAKARLGYWATKPKQMVLV